MIHYGLLKISIEFWKISCEWICTFLCWPESQDVLSFPENARVSFIY